MNMFPQITISGIPYERGRQYGAAVAPLIRHSIASYARLFAHRRGLDWQASQAAALRYEPLLREVAPDLIDEMYGIAAGAGLTPGEILALNVRTELMAGVAVGVAHPDGSAAQSRNRAAGVPCHPDADSGSARPVPIDDGECTTVAAQPGATRSGTPLLAQTWDWQGDQRAACILLRVQAPDQPELLTLTEAGMLAKIGLNSAGIAVSLNLLRSLNDGQSLGMPVHVLLRLMLQAPDFRSARALADRSPAGGSSCVTLASAAGELVSLELSPDRVAEVVPVAGLLAHTNHCIDQAAAAGACPLEPTSTSRERYGRAWELLQASAGRVDVALLQAILRDHEGQPRCICRHPDPRLLPVDRGESVCGIVIDMTGRVMHVAPDIPCRVPFQAVSL
jgi:isopenicillin-N N-acyltransferase-like protein